MEISDCIDNIVDFYQERLILLIVMLIHVWSDVNCMSLGTDVIKSDSKCLDGGRLLLIFRHLLSQLINGVCQPLGSISAPLRQKV